MARRDIGCNYTGTNTPSVNSTGCVTGDGTIGNPLTLSIDPSGNIVCGPNGLDVSGVNATVVVSGCITGAGTAGNPLLVQLAPNGGIECTTSRLAVVAPSGNCLVISTETGNYPPANTAPVTPASTPVDGTVQVEYFDDCIIVWSYNGIAWAKDKEYCPSGAAFTLAIGPCLTGSGTAGAPLNLQIDPNGNIVCGTSGLAVSGVSGQNYANANLIADTAHTHTWANNNLTESFVNGVRQVTHTNGADTAGSISNSITHNVFASNANFENVLAVTAGGTTIQGRSNSGAANNINIIGSPSGVGAATNANPDFNFLENGFNGNDYIGIKGPLNLAQSTVMELPSDVPAIGEVMSITSITGTGTEADPFRPVLEFTASSSTVVTSGCIIGDGTVGDPVTVELDPNGGITCGVSGLRVDVDCGTDALGAVTSVDFTTGFRNKSISVSANPTTLTAFTATSQCWYTLAITNTTGTATVNWPASVLWSGTPPQPTAGAGNVSVFEFYYDGTNFHGRQ